MSGTEVSVFKTAGLPAVSDVSKALRTIDAGAGAGGVILKMDKTGHWVFGSDQTEVEGDSQWAVNPYSFVHGFIAWGEGSPLAEVMAPITEPLPSHGPAPDSAKKGWEPQLGFALVCMTGEDQGLEVRYSATSVGGKKAVQALGLAVAEQVDKNPLLPVPVVLLKKDHYAHKQYGRIYTPIFEVVEYLTLEGKKASEVGAADAGATGGTRRRRAG